MALDVAMGLHFLHSKNIIHFDLKSANILLTSSATAKIADVGLAQVCQIAKAPGTLSTFAYMAPELIEDHACDEKVDIYSFGVVLWEIVTGYKPQRGSFLPARSAVAQ